MQPTQTPNLSSAGTAQSNPPDVIAMMIVALARVRAEEVETIATEYKQSGDVRMGSKEAEVVIAMLEQNLKCRLPGPAQLRKNQITSILSLSKIVKN
jgi:hypothetical protein